MHTINDMARWWRVLFSGILISLSSINYALSFDRWTFVSKKIKLVVGYMDRYIIKKGLWEVVGRHGKNNLVVNVYWKTETGIYIYIACTWGFILFYLYSYTFWSFFLVWIYSLVFFFFRNFDLFIYFIINK